LEAYVLGLGEEGDDFLRLLYSVRSEEVASGARVEVAVHQVQITRLPSSEIETQTEKERKTERGR
jgi:hypothetical protein